MELLKVDTLDQAREKVLDNLAKKELKKETIGIESALGRVLAEDIVSGENIPSFRRSTMDGYAVRALDTQGTTESIPVFLDVIDEVEMGKPALKAVKAGQCAYVPTGGMIPEGADAVVMIEYTEALDEASIAVYQAVAEGKNVVSVGEDISREQTVITKGTVVRAQEIGALAALGIKDVRVYEPWSITIISTGDEVTGIDEVPQPGQVRDINSYGIMALAQKNNLKIDSINLLKDREELLAETVKAAMSRSDMVVVSGGSSQGKKDATAAVIDSLAEPGVFTHGIAVKPGKPTILGFDESTETMMVGLPGHPAAAMMIFELVCMWAMRKRMGIGEGMFITAELTTNAAAAPGRATCLTLQLARDGEAIKATPVLAKSGAITMLSNADGYAVLETNSEGISAGEKVKVHLF